MTNLREKKQEMVKNFNRSAIGDAAVELFKTYGYNGFTMQQVAEKSGMAIGNLYNYFENKEQIIAFVSENIFVSFFSALVETTKEGSAKEKLEKFFRFFFKSSIENRALIRLYDQLNLERKEKLKKILGLLQNVIETGIANNELSKVDPEKSAAYIFSMLIGYCNHVAVDQNIDIYPEKEAKDIIAFLRPSLIRV